VLPFTVDGDTRRRREYKRPGPGREAGPAAPAGDQERPGPGGEPDRPDRVPRSRTQQHTARNRLAHQGDRG
jgi:hypothetical protein